MLEHLSRIDEAQKKITELSSNVVNLQAILTDKRSRGAWGEVQLLSLVRNVMPESSFQEGCAWRGLRRASSQETAEIVDTKKLSHRGCRPHNI